jgi:hypothetical protein
MKRGGFRVNKPWKWLIRLGTQFFPEAGQPLFQPSRLDHHESLSIHPRSSVIGPGQPLGMEQNLFPIDLGVELVEAEIRVGVLHFTFEACSGFTRVTARKMAQSPKAALVKRLQYSRLPEHIARQLPDLPSVIWVEPSATGISRLRGALHKIDCSPIGCEG